MLTSHSQICIPPECGFIQWWFKKYGDWSINDTKNKNRVREYLEDLKTSKKIETWRIDFEKVFYSIYQSDVSNYGDLSLKVIDEYAKQKQPDSFILGDKNNYYIQHLHLINKIYPEAKFILIVRDGRDVACSYKDLLKNKSISEYKPDLPNDISDIANEWATNNKRVLQFFDEIPEQNFYIIRFEDLMLNPSHQLKKVCEFIDLNYDNMQP